MTGSAFLEPSQQKNSFPYDVALAIAYYFLRNGRLDTSLAEIPAFNYRLRVEKIRYRTKRKVIFEMA